MFVGHDTRPCKMRGPEGPKRLFGFEDQKSRPRIQLSHGVEHQGGNDLPAGKDDGFIRDGRLRNEAQGRGMAPAIPAPHRLSLGGSLPSVALFRFTGYACVTRAIEQMSIYKGGHVAKRSAG